MTELIYADIYNKLKDLGALDVKEHKKITSPGHMDLHIDVLQDNDKERIITLAHNYIQNNGVIADPDVEIRIFKGLQKAEALRYQQDLLGIYQSVYPESGKVNSQVKKQLNEFLQDWLQILKLQGFYKEIEQNG